MGTPFLSEIRIFSFNFPPKGWALCNGQLLPINQNAALFALLGTTYGGDGRVNFALPNLQGRVPLHMGNGLAQGTVAGTENVTLVQDQMPQHTHIPVASNNTPARLQADPTNPPALWANSGQDTYAPTANVAMNAAAVDTTGSSAPHDNMAPYLVLNFCIALVGIFPSRN